jgi:methylene-fatty-acyl-phospholipid synthase
VVGFLCAAALLLPERIFYVWLCWSPASFVALCRVPFSGRRVDPVVAVELIFYVFKAIQAGVFAGWCLAFGGGQILPAGGPVAIALGSLLVIGGQALISFVFTRLGRLGVFYGGQFGRPVAWHTGFPFSTLRHPQYVGAVMTIWGIFLIMRFPAPDWTVLPVLETFYYWLSTKLERYERAAASRLSLASEN